MSNTAEIVNLETQNAELKRLQVASFESTSSTNPTTLQEIVNLAKVMAGSGFYPDAKQPMQAAALMILGQQFGLSPAQSLTGIHIVKGKPMLHYSVILAKVRQHPSYDYRITQHTEKVCAIKFYMHGEEIGESVFTDADAKRQGTQNMEKHGKTMLLARAASNGVKWYCPDVLNGMPVYVQGEVLDAEYSDSTISRRDALMANVKAQSALESPEAPDEQIEEPEVEIVEDPKPERTGPKVPDAVADSRPRDPEPDSQPSLTD